jgi:signal transduction histidine kinase
VFRVAAAVEAAYEAVSSKARRGPTPEPVCDRLVGWLTGFGSAFLGDDVLFVETSCAARDEGHTVCRFEGRLGAEWGPEAEEHRALYRREAIGERLAHLDREVFAQAVKIQEQELALEAKRKVEEASRLKSEFLANISHELRTPLNSIVGYADLLLSKLGAKLAETPRKNLERILSNAEHLRALIDGILDISKIEAGRMELVVAATDPRPILDKCVEDTRVLLKSKPVDLLWTPPPLPPVAVDPIRFQQCVLNVLGNAAKFTASGSIRVEARRITGRRGGRECGFLSRSRSPTPGPGSRPSTRR